MSKQSLALTAALLLAIAGATAPALAKPIGVGGSSVTKSDLEKKGYKCEVVATGFWECTKSGSTTYWCDSGSCQPKPFRVNTNRFQRAPISGMKMFR